MNTAKRLGVAAAVAAMLAGASAFAEDRPRPGTRGEGGRIHRDRESSAQPRAEGRPERRGGSPDTADRGRERDRDEPGRTYESYDQRRYGRGRESFESRRYDHSRDQARRGRPYYHHGPVTRHHRYGNGYRVWIGGARHPFFVPLAYWDPWRFRVGVSIGMGGWYNPLGYYEYYDGYQDGYRAGRHRSGRVYRTVELTGWVEEYDERRRVALIRDDVTDRLVTVYMHSRDARLNHLRPGDFVELEGGWRDGIFEAYRVFDVD